ncbi:DUF4748 domain-containing protein [Silurus meridionalis]|uniref:Uncharacterized protein n=1 Tax=Silurus meridionalis TaxID=175797 RepID=A0A8T0BVN0_SILME|nr:DUF4748 domain-containing protein [Silurus meridionalis]KAF7711074.1 hypothetical protein HF521_000085 [Silurus meridionalis]KAI5108667.1 putative hydrolase PNKD [Silurus meridionalis]
MAAPCRRFLRSAIEGLRCFSSGNFHFHTPHTQRWTFSGLRWCDLQHRALHCSSSCSLNITRTDAAKSTDPLKEREKKEEEEAEEDSGPEYIPKRKAKNPMKVIGYAWIIGLPSGVIGFILAKRQVDKNRLEQLKIRQRMKKSNEGEYERERYKPAAEEQ